MKIKELYKQDISRGLNPAVSTEDITSETISAEINEYVFTDDIINGLFNILNTIKNHNVKHNGIWINGFFGSGKSHFLKFLGYCVNPLYRETALARLEEAVKEHDPFTNKGSRCDVTIDDFKQIASWVRKATVDRVMFNIGAYADANSDARRIFTEVAWNQFNRFRGYNSENLALAQHFEKLLDKNGKFEEFKSILAEQDGFDWENDASDLVVGYLDRILSIAQELLPNISVDSIKRAIENDSENVSPAAFCKELKEYIDSKNDPNYRLLFLVDEIALFLGDNKQLLLQVQEVVTGMNNICGEHAWLACTSQQDLSRLMNNMQIQEASGDYGQIMGRFETRVSLRSNETQYITQKRLLDKNEDGVYELQKLYDAKKLHIDNQFVLPTSFNAFKTEADFTDYYPFVPYQFSLMSKVLNAFGEKGYIDEQYRGNERSIIKITHTTSQTNADDATGNFVSFDAFYNAMFASALRNVGQLAITNAEQMIREYNDKEFGTRVLNILFMICNLNSADRLLFPATLDYIVTLLMTDVDAEKKPLMERTQNALAFLREKHIIRIEKLADTNTDVFCFQTEDEIEAEREIESQKIDPETYARRYYEVFSRHFGLGNNANREHYCSRDFAISWNINGKHFLANNSDVDVDFIMNKTGGNLFGNGSQKKLSFDVWSLLEKDRQLQNDFFYYCQVQQYVALGASSDTRAKTIEAIRNRVQDLYRTSIEGKLKNILNRADVYSDTTLIKVEGDGATRYHNALQAHLANVYPHAKLAVGSNVPTNAAEFQAKVKRAVEPNEYGPLNPITDAERLLEQYIAQRPVGTIFVNQIFTDFEKTYGWSNIATAYFLNELRRRQMRGFTYMNNPTVDNATVAANLLGRAKEFTVVEAKAISRDLINNFIVAWREIFNDTRVTTTYDSEQLYQLCKQTRPDENHVSIQSAIMSYEGRKAKIIEYPFCNAYDPIIELLKKWQEERNHQKFFELVIADKDEAIGLLDKAKIIRQFTDDFLEGYREICRFAKDNKDAFTKLDDQTMVNSLMPILSDQWPMPNMRDYSAAKRQLETALANKISEVKAEIKANYQEAFVQLRSLASQYGVEYTVKEDNILLARTSSPNLLVLLTELDTSAFLSRETDDIIARYNAKNDTHPTEPTRPGDPTTPAKPRVVVIAKSLKTRSARTLKTEADVDEYLMSLKTQLMQSINALGDNESIQIK